MKRIGVLIPSITDDLQTQLLDGIFRTVSAAGCDVIVLTTLTNGLEFHIQSEIMEGEESIYCLLDRAALDGILLASQYFVKESVRRMISEKIRRAGIPCIDLGGSDLGFETVSVPQDDAVYELTTHLIVKHGCRELMFLAGQDGNPDSEQRMSGFLRAADEHSCLHEIFYGDFWKLRAGELGNEFIQHRRKIPDAVVCANDIMAVTLCDVLDKGGINVPGDVIVTGFDGHICAISNFPSVTTISGIISETGRAGALKLLRMIGGTSLPDTGSGIHMIYGASCGCVEKMTDYQAAALKVREQIRRDTEVSDMLEMRINADVITRASGVESLSELTAIVDQTAHIIKSYCSLHLCILPDWDSEPMQPDICRTKPYPRQMLCAVTKEAWKDGRNGSLFPTSQIVPMLEMPHSPVLLIVLPLHASSQVFGYCGFVYGKADDFKASVMLFNFLSAVANGLRTLRHRLYAEYLQKKVEEASLYDKMTDMLSKKGLLLYLGEQEQTGRRNGIMLVTIAMLTASQNNRSSSIMTDNVLQSELLLANAIRLISGRKYQTARLDKRTFAIIFSLEDETPEHCAEELMIQLEVLIRKMQEGSAAAFLPEPYYVCGELSYPAEKCLSELWELLSSSMPAEKGFTGISQLKKLRREIHKAPELEWSLSVLAKRLNISKSYVQKLYREHFGISYIDDLIEARIDMAKKLLLTTDLRISEVAASCGYQNATHFMRQFRAKTGLSPSGFRDRR